MRPLPSGPVSERRTSANAPFKAGRASTTYVRSATATLADTGTPASARSAFASVSAVPTGPDPVRARGSSTMSTPWACSVCTSLRDAAA